MPSSRKLPPPLHISLGTSLESVHEPSCLQPERLRVALCIAVNFHRESEHELTSSAHGLRERVSGSRPTGITLDESVLALRSRITELLTSWARLVIEERGVAAPRNCSVPGLAEFLGRHLSWLTEHPAGPDFDREVAALMRSCHTLREETRSARRELGGCPEPGCSGTLYAVLGPTESAPGRPGSSVVCDQGHAFAPHDWLLLAGPRQSAGIRP